MSHMSSSIKRFLTSFKCSKGSQNYVKIYWNSNFSHIVTFKSQKCYHCSKRSDIYHGRACSFSFFTNYSYLAVTEKWEALMGYVLIFETQAGDIAFPSHSCCLTTEESQTCMANCLGKYLQVSLSKTEMHLCTFWKSCL